MRAPARQGIAVDGVEQGLGDGLEEVLGREVGLPEPLAGAEELVRGGAGDDEVLGEVYAAYAVEAVLHHISFRSAWWGAEEGVEWSVDWVKKADVPADVRLPRRLIDARHHGAHEPGAEAPLVQARTHELGEGLRADVPLLAQTVHVDLVPEELGDGGDVGGEAGEAEEGGGAVGEDLGEVVGDGHGLQAEAQVAGDGHAVLAHHRHACAAVYILLLVFELGFGVCGSALMEKGEDMAAFGYVCSLGEWLVCA